jgi:hypothetical protein
MKTQISYFADGKRHAAFVILLLCGFLCNPARFSAQQPALDPLLRWRDHIVQRQLQRRVLIATIRSMADAERREQSVRERFLANIGGLPKYRGPLNPRVTGRIQTESYTIEKVIFESLAGVLVTADLCQPNQSGHYPGILLEAGHTQEGKPEGQILAANLTLKHFAVLAFDPIGQGEREQTCELQADRPLAGWSVPEHIQLGPQSMLIGESVARYFIWDAKRALDYLASWPEVDAERLGAVGCSGGGAPTTFIGALDPRLKVVAPSCFINSYHMLFPGPDPDSEMSPPNLLSSGLDMADHVDLIVRSPGKNEPAVRFVILNCDPMQNLAHLQGFAATGRVYFDIAMVGGVGRVARLAQKISIHNVLFGSHYPLFYFESALLKVREAGLTDAETGALLEENAHRLLEA